MEECNNKLQISIAEEIYFPWIRWLNMYHVQHLMQPRTGTSDFS